MELSENIKKILRPAGRVRFKIERLKYGGAAILDANDGNAHLAATLRAGKAQAIAKLGAAEQAALRHYLVHRDTSGFCAEWGGHATMLYRNAGVFPCTPAAHSKFAQRYLDDIGAVTTLCVWFRWGERSLVAKYAPAATYVPLESLEPYYFDSPWSQSLAGKRVVVISPFAASIQSQYAQRHSVWRRHEAVLPDFELRTIRCPMSAALAAPEDKDWFAALERMSRELDTRDYDTVIVGAGAWSLPLVAHAYRSGKWGIHLGGSTQILFGIVGGRWDKHPKIAPLFNASWIRPSLDERPKTYQSVEGGCYW